ncbi:hypothetical protein TKK_0004094 [Trichogramma kaykai]|uniref:Aromatic-L-amino-acid decarboxylase n=1 Tax=Trichogramma kaykai TaxID=54128 RepID=A0ABD2XKI1_9HYME
MNHEEFRDFAKAAVDYVADYNESLRDRPVLPAVKPGYLAKLLPDEAPLEPDNWRAVLEDVERHVMPGITHWNSPHFHAYFPTSNSYPAIVGDILSSGIGCVGFSWITSPACTELEMITLDWLAKLLGLPEHFLNSSEGPGGGCIQGSASESTLISLLAARETTIRRVRQEHPEWSEGLIRSKLVSYTSDQANSSVEKAGRLAAIPMRLLPGDEECRLRGATLLDQVRRDLEEGLIPCALVATLGTTPTCAFDDLAELGPLCREHKIWLHVDAAYAGAAFVCPEFRPLMAGVEYCDSFNFNPHKWLLVNADCSAHWMKDARHITEPFRVERVYLASDQNKPKAERDYRHWQLSLGRRFRSMKLWLVLRLYGQQGLQKHIRDTISQAEYFHRLVAADERFEIPVKPSMGLICFRFRGDADNSSTRLLLDRLMLRRRVYVIAGAYRDRTLVRFVVCSRYTTAEDIDYAWSEITEVAGRVLRGEDEKESLAEEAAAEQLARLRIEEPLPRCRESDDESIDR